MILSPVARNFKIYFKEGIKVSMYIKQSLENKGLMANIPFMLMSLRQNPHENILNGQKSMSLGVDLQKANLWHSFMYRIK